MNNCRQCTDISKYVIEEFEESKVIDKFSGDYDWLSNFYFTEIWLDGRVYRSVEHAYQAAKSPDMNYRAEIHRTPTPGKAKRLGARVTVREDWDQVKIGVMEKLLLQKFSKPYFKAMLIGTGDKSIVENNKWGDTYWGVCDGVGENNLGKLIMVIRDKLMGDGHEFRRQILEFPPDPKAKDTLQYGCDLLRAAAKNGTEEHEKYIRGKW